MKKFLLLLFCARSRGYADFLPFCLWAKYMATCILQNVNFVSLDGFFAFLPLSKIHGHMFSTECKFRFSLDEINLCFFF